MGAHDGDGAMHGRRLLYLVTEDWVFLLHRLPMARAARDAGFQVTVATRINDSASRAAIESEGFRVVPLGWRRRNFNPAVAVADVFRLARLYRDLRPDVVHHVALKPVVLGGLAAWIAGTGAVVNAVTGLGSAFTGAGRGLIANMAGLAARTALGPVLRRPGSVLLVENPDDAATLTRSGIAAGDRTVVIRGSGVDTDRYVPSPEPAESPFVIGCAARLLANKGIPELVAAHRKLIARGLDVRLLLAGDGDPESPTNIPPATIEEWRALPGVELLGKVSDIRTLWARAHVACLPSHREGLPMALMEAAACGRALVATDVPGCREICVDGRNGLLTPLGDVDALADALEALARDPERRRRFAEAGRAITLSDLSAKEVGRRVVALYHRVLSGHSPSTDATAERETA